VSLLIVEEGGCSQDTGKENKIHGVGKSTETDTGEIKSYQHS
jgi:hypothetical protein